MINPITYLAVFTAGALVITATVVWEEKLFRANKPKRTVYHVYRSVGTKEEALNLIEALDRAGFVFGVVQRELADDEVTRDWRAM